MNGDLAVEVERWLERAERADAVEDAELGDARGDEMPAWLADKQQRLAKIRQAKAALEAEAEAEVPRPDDGARPGPSSGMMDKGRPKRAADGGPPDQAQRNFTDPDSRIMVTRDGFVQGYNGQIAVDGHCQVITAHRLTTNGADYGALAALVDDTTRRCGRRPRAVSADAGFCNEDNLAALEARGIAGYLMPAAPPPPGQRHRPTTDRARQPDGAHGRRLGARDDARATACASRSSSPCSARSRPPVASDGSCCAASTRPKRMGPDLHRPQPHQARQPPHGLRTSPWQPRQAPHPIPCPARNHPPLVRRAPRRRQVSRLVTGMSGLRWDREGDGAFEQCSLSFPTTCVKGLKEVVTRTLRR